MNLKLVIDVPLTLQQQDNHSDETTTTTRIRELERTAHSEDTEAFVVAASHVSLSTTALELEGKTSAAADESKHEPAQWAAFFLSSAITESVLSDFDDNHDEHNNNNHHNHSISSRTFSHDETIQLSRRLLSLVHPFLAQNFCLKGIVSVQSNPQHAPADLVLLNLSHAAPMRVVEDDLLQITNGQTIHSGPEDCILKTLLLSQLEFQWEGQRGTSAAAASPTQQLGQPHSNHHNNNNQHHHEEYFLPTCPVCLHRIDPNHLGLPTPPPHQLCSQFCAPPNLVVAAAASSSHGSGVSRHESLSSSCPQQRLLRPWASPCRCYACHVIDKYWKTQVLPNDDDEDRSDNGHHHHQQHNDPLRSTSSSGLPSQQQQQQQQHRLRCFQCELEETLWVCLTCGYVGCGRYSNRHSVEHFDVSGHPYSLELATLRIWDYATGDFSHRADVLICPSSPPLLFPWIQHSSSRGIVTSSSIMAQQQSQPPYLNQPQPRHLYQQQQPYNHQQYPYSLHDHMQQQHGYPQPLLHGAAGGVASSPSTQGPMGGGVARSASSVAAHNGGLEAAAAADSAMKSPKKAFMIGEEYEALLQSALEDQAQHYEGEMTGLRARLSGETFDQSTMTRRDKDEIDTLQAEIASLRSEIESASRELVDWQGQEAGHRANTQQLLREQQVVQDLLSTIQAETAQEQASGAQQMEELELQIADLTANQKMRRQFSEDEELKQAQIWGSSQNSNINNNNGRNSKKGKKLKRGFRK